MSQKPRPVQVGVLTTIVVLLSGIASYILIGVILLDAERTFGLLMTFVIEILLGFVYLLIWSFITNKEGK